MNSLHVSHHPCAAAGEEGSGGDSDSAGKLSGAKQNVTRAARNTSQQIKSVAGDTAARAKESAQRAVSSKREEAASRIGGYSSAIHESARSLEEQDPNIAWFTHQAADRLERVADYVRNRDFAGLRADAESIAHRHPAVFFGAMFGVGLLVGNAMRASRRNIADDSMASSTGDQPDWMPSSTDPLQNPVATTSTPVPPAPTGY